MREQMFMGSINKLCLQEIMDGSIQVFMVSIKTLIGDWLIPDFLEKGLKSLQVALKLAISSKKRQQTDQPSPKNSQ